MLEDGETLVGSEKGTDVILFGNGGLKDKSKNSESKKSL